MEEVSNEGEVFGSRKRDEKYSDKMKANPQALSPLQGIDWSHDILFDGCSDDDEGSYEFFSPTELKTFETYDMLYSVIERAYGVRQDIIEMLSYNVAKKRMREVGVKAIKMFCCEQGLKYSARYLSSS